VAWLGKGGRKPKIHIRIGGRENGVWTVYKSGITRQALGKYKIEYAPATNQLKFYVNDLVHSMDYPTTLPKTVYIYIAIAPYSGYVGVDHFDNFSLTVY